MKRETVLDCRGRKIKVGERTFVMGILNITPDSFSDGGEYFSPEKALERALKMVEEGADIIDVGGESTRPGHVPVDAEEEIGRVLPVIELLSGKIEVPISIDTYKAEVARRAVEAGASMINDIWGLRGDPEMAATVSELGVPYIMMHNQHGTGYSDIMGDMIDFFRDGVEIASNAGVRTENIIIDPGIGFGKTWEHNLEVIRRMKELEVLGYPVLLGPSRKSFIGRVLDLPVEERLEGTLAAAVIGIFNGADIIRVHDVKEMVRAARMADAIKDSGARRNN